MHKPSHEMREGRGGEARAGSSLRRGVGVGGATRCHSGGGRR